MASLVPNASRIRRPLSRSVLLREEAVFVVVVALQLGVTAIATDHNPDEGQLNVFRVVMLVIAALAVPARLWYPRAALAVAFVATLLAWTFARPPGPVFAALVITLSYVVLTGHRRLAMVAAAAGYVAFPWLGVVTGHQDALPFAFLLGLAAWLATLISVTEVVRSRRERAAEATRSHAEALRRQATEERLVIARELHDVVAHNMALINMRAGIALHLLDRDPEPVRDALGVIRDASKDALVELRSILGVLRHVDDGQPRRPTTGLDQLGDLIARTETAGVRVRLDADESLEAVALPREIDLAAYRIVQESLTNVARHANPPDAVVRIRVAGDTLEIDVLDEGVPVLRPSGATLSGGNGIAGMTERAASVGGTLTTGPRPGRGFAVRARLPIGGPS
ncbi:sensor histidine kinase [soil metagenome]